MFLLSVNYILDARLKYYKARLRPPPGCGKSGGGHGKASVQPICRSQAPLNR